MFETIQNSFGAIRDALAFAPDGLVGTLILAAAAAVAISIHGAILRLLRRLLGERRPYLQTFLAQTKGQTRLALLVFALFVALPATPFDIATITLIAKLLVVATVLLMGWAALTVVNMTAEFYLRRFRLDVDDNLLARKHITQVRVLARAANTLLVIATLGAALMTFDAVRQYGVSLFASAGVAGLVAGLAARPVLSNLIAGVQIAMTQPIRIDDGVLVENEFGRVEEITATYVVIRLWDLRRLIVPLANFIEKPFQNWTRDSTNLIGSVLLYVDYTAPVERIRAKVVEIVEGSKFWDRQVVKLQVTDAREGTIELRAVVSAKTSGDAFDLRCEVREKLIDFLQREIPTALPRQRQETVATEQRTSATGDR